MKIDLAMIQMTFPDLVHDPKAGRSVPYWVHSSLDFEQEVDWLSSDSLRARSNYGYVVVPAIDVAVVVDIALVVVALVLFVVVLVLFVVVLSVVVLAGIGID